MKTLYALLLSLLLTAALAADWPQFHFNAAHTAAANHEDFSPAALQKTFAADLGARITASPVVAGGRVFVGARSGRFFAVNAATGAVLWQKATRGPITSAAAIGDSIVVVGSQDSTLYAFTLDGADAWSLRTTGAIIAPVTFAPDLKAFYIGDTRGTLYSVDMKGAIRWTYLDTAFHPRPEILTGVVYDSGRVGIPYGDCLFHALLDSGGTRRLLFKRNPWNPPTEYVAPFVTEPVLYGGHVYTCVTGHAGVAAMYAIDFSTGAHNPAAAKPSYPGLKMFHAAVAADSGFIYACWTNFRPGSFHVSTGLPSTGWYSVSTMDPRFSLSGPALSRNHMIFLTEEGVLTLVGRRDGRVAYEDTFAAPGTPYGFRGSRSAPALSDGRIFFGADDGKLHCYSGTPPASALGAAPAHTGIGLSAGPVPANPSVRIVYRIPGTGNDRVRVRLVLAGPTGAIVRTLAHGFFTPGSRTHFVDGSGLASGVYLLRLYAGDEARSLRLVITR